MMIDLTKLPLSITSFSQFAANSMIYVDKTDLVANLARFRNPIFLSRPRRFGKSTLVSTFHELFSNGLDKFQGLKIVTDNLWNDKTYKVIHLDLSKIKEQSGDVTFNESFLQQLDDNGLTEENDDGEVIIANRRKNYKKSVYIQDGQYGFEED